MRVQHKVFKEVPIVKGPGATRLLEVAVALLDQSNGTERHNASTRVTFTIKPEGSTKTSQMMVKITSVSSGESMNQNYYVYRGIAQRGVMVYGYYSLSEPTGSFIRDYED